MSESTKASAPSHDDIAILAYQLWQIDGYVHGRDRQHWLLAEEFLVRGEQLPEVMATNLGDSEEIAAHVAAIRNRLNTMEVPNDLGGDSHQWAADHGSERDAGQFATREES